MGSIGIRLDSAYQFSRTTWQRSTPWRVHESFPDTSKTTYGMTADATGVLDVTATVTWTAASTEQRSVRLTRNGVIVGAAQSITSGTVLNAAWPGVAVAAGDLLVIECYAVQTLGSQRTIAAGSSLIGVQRPEPAKQVDISAVPTVTLGAFAATTAVSSLPVVVPAGAPVLSLIALPATVTRSAAPRPARVISAGIAVLTVTALAATSAESEPARTPSAVRVRVLMPVAQLRITVADQRARALVPTKRRSIRL